MVTPPGCSVALNVEVWLSTTRYALHARMGLNVSHKEMAVGSGKVI